MAVVGSHEVLHHLDLDICCRSGLGQVFCMHHHSTNRLNEEGAGLYRLGPPRRYLGFFLHHLPRHPALLPASPLDLDTYVDYNW